MTDGTISNKQNLLIMLPGVGEDELSLHLSNKKNNKRKIALYFGSMIRKGMIPWITDLFSKLNGWELHLIVPRGDEDILETENVKYLGSVSHDRLFDIIFNADIILIPNPKNEYMNRFIPMKVAYTLLSCKPVNCNQITGFI